MIPVPVAYVDRAKAFSAEEVGFEVDLDHRAGDEFRVVQLTPPGSACSIAVGTGIVGTAPGSVQGLHLVVADIDAARGALRPRGGSRRGPRPRGNSVRAIQRPGRHGWTLQQLP